MVDEEKSVATAAPSCSSALRFCPMLGLIEAAAAAATATSPFISELLMVLLGRIELCSFSPSLGSDDGSNDAHVSISQGKK